MRLFAAIGLAVALAAAPVISGCSRLTTEQPGSPGVTQAQADLHKVEQAYAGALNTIRAMNNADLIKGARIAQVQTAVNSAKAAIDIARATVDAGKVDLGLILTASVRVVELLTAIKGG